MMPGVDEITTEESRRCPQIIDGIDILLAFRSFQHLMIAQSAYQRIGGFDLRGRDRLAETLPVGADTQSQRLGQNKRELRRKILAGPVKLGVGDARARSRGWIPLLAITGGL